MNSLIYRTNSGIKPSFSGINPSNPLLQHKKVANRSKNGIKIQSVNCPLCRNASKKVLYRDLADVEDGVIGKYTISMCLNCGLSYLSVRPTEKSLPYCYYQDYHVRVESRRAPVTQYLYTLKHRHDSQLIKRIIKRVPKSLLDIGCGSGGLLLELSKQWGKRCKLAGIELAPPASEKLTGAGIKLYIGSLEKMKPHGKFEVVTMNEFLEHVYNPVKALKSASSWLKDDGLLIGEVPDFGSPWRRIFPRHWQGFHVPRHMTFFNKKTIGMVLEAAGFELLSTGNRFNPGDISVSLCSLLINKLAPGVRPRHTILYIPLMLLTAPLSIFMDKILHAPGILEFVAVKKKTNKV
jgi:SAM-dependent methyltransferase